MSISAVSTALSESTYSAGSERVPKKTLGQEEFFKLLSVQLASQDPMKPMADTDFIAQMSNFSSLEMMGQMNKNFASFTSQQDFLGVQNMLGRNVTVQKTNGEQVTGLATAVHSDPDSKDTMITIDGEDYPVTSVKRVEVAG